MKYTAVNVVLLALAALLFVSTGARGYEVWCYPKADCVDPHGVYAVGASAQGRNQVLPEHTACKSMKGFQITATCLGAYGDPCQNCPSNTVVQSKGQCVNAPGGKDFTCWTPA
ncbi:unnamed protein product [Parajaminaea phylloscopi]